MPGNLSIEQVTFTRENLADITEVGTAAFYDDPFFKYLIPNDGMRRRGLRLFLRATVAGAKNAADIYCSRGDGGRINGVAVFVRPGAYPLPIGAQLRQGISAFWGLMPRPQAIPPGLKYLNAIDKAHPKKEELWYLLLLAVDPSVQRGGIGGTLQAQVYPAADGVGLATYLETQKADNVGYYRRFGYEVVEELHPVKDGPPLWTMRREPRAPEG